MGHSNGDQLFDCEELVAFARADFEGGNLEGALKKLKLALATDADLPEANAIAARIYARLGLYKRSQALFEKYLESNPSAPLESLQLGMTYFDCGALDDAISIWTVLLDQVPDYPPALYYCALAYSQLGMLEKAKHSIQTLTRVARPSNLYFGRANELLQDIESGKLSEIVEPHGAVEKAIKSRYQIEH